MDGAARTRLQQALIRLRDGDRLAFDAVYAALWPLFLGFARRALEADAEDVAQEALLKLFAHVDQFDPDRDALAWALGIVGFEIRSARHRRARRREELDETVLSAQVAAGPGPDATAVTRDLQAAAAQVLGTLKDADIEVLERAARGEREPGPSFRKRLERALARLRLAWRAAHDND